MDETQNQLSGLLKAIPGCTSSRQKLKAALMDLLVSKRREVNLLLCAYDDNIIEKLEQTTDPTLYALRMIKSLSDDYGLTTDAAKWAISTWCIILGKTEIANALEEIPTATSASAPVANNTYTIGIGTYRAGFDFKAGDISLKHITNSTHAPGMTRGVTVLHGGTIDCYINSSPSRKGAKKLCSFNMCCHLEIENGQYLIITTSSEFADRDMIRIELSECN